MTMTHPECGLDDARLWRHSVTTAVGAAVLARHAGEPDAVAFTAGLLHDLGKLVLSATEPGLYRKLLRDSRGQGEVLVAAELKNLGVSHAMVGARLLARWDLPTDVAAAVLYHHSPRASISSFERLGASVYLGNELAHRLADPDARAFDSVMSRPEPLEILQLTPDDLPKLAEQTAEDLKRLEGLFHMSS